MDFRLPYMEHQSAFTEGQSINWPPLFNGSDYAYWKVRMTIYLKSIDYDMWLIIKNGYVEPIIEKEKIVFPKLEKDWDDIDKKKASLNARCMNTLVCALNKTEFNRISHCLTAQEIWTTLEITHEGTSQVKESKLALLNNEFENFKMTDDESIKVMYARLNTIIYHSRALGKEISELELVRKILRVLPKNFESKVTAIQEAKDLKSIKVDELIGNLISHEIEVYTREDQDEKDHTSSSEALVDENKEAEALISKGFKKILKIKHDKIREEHFRKLAQDSSSESERSEKEGPTCFRCNKPGHFMRHCPLEKKKEKSTRWADMIDEESSDDQEKAHLCLMGKATSNDKSKIMKKVRNFSKVDLIRISCDLIEKNENMCNQIARLQHDKGRSHESMQDKETSLEKDKSRFKIHNEVCYKLKKSCMKLKSTCAKERNWKKVDTRNHVKKFMKIWVPKGMVHT